MKRACFLAIILLLISGCRGVTPKDSSTVVWRLAAEPDTLNPITSTDAYASSINGFLNDSLLERDRETLEWKPLLAERWEVSDGGKTLKFWLREGITWSDGMPLTIEDIIFSYERVMDPAVDSSHLRVYYQDVESVKAFGERGIVFHYKKPYFLALQFCGGIPIVPKHLFKDGDNFNNHTISRNPVGTGPYRFVRWETGKNIRIERRDDYWGRKIGRFPDIGKIRFDFITEDAVALQILKKGDIDYAQLRPIQWVRQIDSEHFRKSFEKYQYYSPNYNFIGWNLKRPMFADARVRRAMTHLVNRQGILEKLNFGLGKVVTGPFFIFGKDYLSSIQPLLFDPEKAKALLAEAGWKDHDGDGFLDKDGKMFRFEFLYPSGRRFSERLASILKEDLKNVGIVMDIRQLEWAVFIKNLDERQFDAVTLGWSFGLEQDPYQVWHSTQGEKGSNFVGFKNNEVDGLIEEGRTEFDQEKRSRLYQRIHEIIDQEQPYTFLFANPSLVALHKKITNVMIYPTGMDPMEWRLNVP